MMWDEGSSIVGIDDDEERETNHWSTSGLFIPIFGPKLSVKLTCIVASHKVEGEMSWRSGEKKEWEGQNRDKTYCSVTFNNMEIFVVGTLYITLFE